MHFTHRISSARLLSIFGAATCLLGCGPAASDAPTSSTGGASAGAPNNGANGGAGSANGGAAGSSGTSGSSAAAGNTLGGAGSGGTGTSVAGAGVSGSGGSVSSGGANAAAGSGGAPIVGGASGSAGAPGNGCNLPATVSFKHDVEGFLSPSCSGTGCHVIDNKSTMSAGGYDHAYDWITATAHASSCPSGAPKRFEVVVAVIEKANPASCSKSRVMPPDPATHAPLTPCQLATLEAWLAEPLVTQLHRADDTSPTTPYAMPPFN